MVFNNQPTLGVRQETRDRLRDLKGDRSYDDLLNEWADQHDNSSPQGEN